MELQILTGKTVAGLSRACIAALLCLCSCTERLELRTDDAEPHLVIYGRMTNETVRQSVSITRSAGFFATTPPEGIGGAEVTVTSNGMTLLFYEDRNAAGNYITDNAVGLTDGYTYTLDVKVDFNGNGVKRHYRAESFMNEPAAVNDVRFANSSVFPDYISVMLYATLPETGSHYGLRLWRNDVMIDDSLQLMRILDKKNLATNELNGVPCFFLDQKSESSRLKPGDDVTLAIDSITEEYAEFLNNAQEQSGGSIPLFSGPPANVATNIYPVDPGDKTPLAGFFTACSRSSMTTTFR